MLSIGQRFLSPARKAHRRHLRSATFIVLLVAAFILFAPWVKSGAEASWSASSASAVQKSRGRFSGQQPARDNLQRVTFVSDQPEAAIYLRRDGQQFETEPFDVTRKDGTIARKLPSGKYFVKAVKQGFGPAEERPIEVLLRPYITTPPLKVGPRLPTPTPTPTPAATPTPTPTPTETLVERFFDPTRSAQVKLEDWEQRRKEILIEQANTKDDSQVRQLNMELHFVLGQIAYLNGNFRGAIKEFTDSKSFSTSHSYAPAQYGLGQAYLADGEPERAVAAFESARRSSPELVAVLAYAGLSEAYTMSGKGSNAATALARARELKYQLQGTNLNLNLARYYVKKGEWDKALKELQGPLAQEQSAEVSVLLGEAYLGKGQRIKANEKFESVTNLGNKVATAYRARAHYGIARALFKEDNRKEAFDAIERAKELDPEGDMINNEDVRKEINKINGSLKKFKERANEQSIPNKPSVP